MRRRAAHSLQLQLRITQRYQLIGKQLTGKTAFVVGTADPSIHRLTYINCRYGLTSADAVPQIEIQVSLYATAAQAVARIAPNVQDFTDHGATASDATVDGIAARVLTGGTGADYENTTLVLAFGQRTVAVSVGDVVPADQQQAALGKLADLALRRTE